MTAKRKSKSVAARAYEDEVEFLARMATRSLTDPLASFASSILWELTSRDNRLDLYDALERRDPDTVAVVAAIRAAFNRPGFAAACLAD